MKTETHYKLALMLRDRCFSELLSPQKAGFVFGCIEPDINPFSYLRGFKVRPFYGHDWQNIRPFITSALDGLKSRRASPYWLGIVIHYLCDAFTSSHNRWFDAGVRQHNMYEKRLHDLVLKGGNRLGQIIDLKNEPLSRLIIGMHKRYEQEAHSIETDAEYIISAVQTVTSAVRLGQGIGLEVCETKVLRCSDRYISRP